MKKNLMLTLKKETIEVLRADLFGGAGTSNPCLDTKILRCPHTTPPQATCIKEATWTVIETAYGADTCEGVCYMGQFTKRNCEPAQVTNEVDCEINKLTKNGCPHASQIVVC